ncbi:MAG: hypothetical protein AB1700_09700 [Bacillota bacterium]
MQKRLVLMVAIALVGIILIGVSVQASDPPIGCWYTGYYYTTWSFRCWDLKCAGYIPYVDGAYITYHNQYECPDGSIGYDTATRFDHCTIWPPCHPIPP